MGKNIAWMSQMLQTGSRWVYYTHIRDDCLGGKRQAHVRKEPLSNCGWVGICETI